MTIKSESHYDKVADVFYVSFGDEEPTYVENIDDIMLIEIGCFSGLPKGFRVLGFRENQVVVGMGVIIRELKSHVHQLMKSQRQAILDQEPILTNFCKTTLPKVFAKARF